MSLNNQSENAALRGFIKKIGLEPDSVIDLLENSSEETEALKERVALLLRSVISDITTFNSSALTDYSWEKTNMAITLIPEESFVQTIDGVRKLLRQTELNDLSAFGENIIKGVLKGT